MSIRGIFSALGAILLVASVGIAVAYLEKNYSWTAGTGIKIIFGIGIFAVLAVTFRIYQQSTQTKPSSIPNFIGLLLLGMGAILYMGNKTGAFITFPFAGATFMGIGAVIYGVSKLKR